MFSRVIPSWDQIEQFKQPLTEGEQYLLKFLDGHLKKDTLFQGSDLTNYDGWLIFVQPYLNGSRPDIIIFHPKVGVQIFEVKDWNLANYSFKPQGYGEHNRSFCVSDGRGTHTIKSPIRQVEHYKEIIVGQLIPQIGESFDENILQYGLIKTAVYFHKSTTVVAQDMFRPQVKDFSKFPVFGYDSLIASKLDKVVPDSRIYQSKYWQKDWNKELLFWLQPPFHSLDQGIRLVLNDDQKKCDEPHTGHYRIRGVAGSGKTQVLAYRAGQLASQGYRVLVVSYNITLWHLIHDMIQRSPFAFRWDNVTTTYFHGFCKDILNDFGEPWPKDESQDDESLFREVIPHKVVEVIRRNNYTKYDAILIDEGQDFCIEWYTMLCCLLTSRDEVVVVCDKKQNIYGRTTEWLDKRRKGVEKFGVWIELKKIIRLPEHVARIAVEFSEKFNLNQDIKVAKIEKPDLFNQFQAHVVWWNIEDKGFSENDWLDKVDEAFELIKSQATHNHPSDTVILLPNKDYGFTSVDHFKQKKSFKVNHVFEKGRDINYHRHKKAFWMGDSRLKMSTIHSFKGWEVPNVIVVIPSYIPGDENLYDMTVYTAMTRSKENLIVINQNNRYWEFGESVSHEW